MSTGLVVREEYLFKSDSGKVRTHVSCKTAPLLLFITSSALQGEDTTAARNLRCQLIDILVEAVTAIERENLTSPNHSENVIHASLSESPAVPCNPLYTTSPIPNSPSQLLETSSSTE